MSSWVPASSALIKQPPMQNEDDEPEELEFEDDDGTTYTWDKSSRKYVPKELPLVGYQVEDMVYPGVGDKVGIQPSTTTKRSLEEEEEAAAEALLAEAGGGSKGGKNKKAKKMGLPGQEGVEPQKPPGWFDLKQNTSVYASGLPLDVTVAEVSEAFSKYGVIKEDEKGLPRIKIYVDKATGQPKGDCLVTYLKEPSVELAIQMLDGTEFRFGAGKTMTVEAAKFEMKGEEFRAKAANKSLKKKQLEKLEKRLHWGGADDKVAPEKVTVILKQMFTQDELAEDLLLAEELEKDVKAECSKMGVVEKIKVFKSNPEGVISVRFKEPTSAAQCIAVMNGRWFGGRQIDASMWDGVKNYAIKVKESWEEEEARLEAYARELEKEEGDQ